MVYRKKQIRYRLSFLSGIILIMAACNTVKTVYVPENRFIFDSVQVTELNYNQFIVELSDNYLGNISDGNTFFALIYEEGKGYFIGELNMSTGQLSIKEPFLKEYNEKNSIYWDVLSYHDVNGFDKTCGPCCALTPTGGKTEDYGFKAVKNFWGDTTHRVELGFYYSREESVDYEAVEIDVGKDEPCFFCYPSNTEVNETYEMSQVFYNGLNSGLITGYFGYENGFMNESIKGSRYYPLTENTYAAFQPCVVLEKTKCMLFYYDLVKKTSWGAEYDFKDYQYIDGVVSGDGKTICFLITRMGDYKILKLHSSVYKRGLMNLVAEGI